MQLNFMRLIKVAAFAVAACEAFSFAEDIVATTSNGSTVILHDNGRWEYYQNNANIRDVRESAVPKDARFEVSVLYESPDKVKKNVRMALEADFATEEEIKDSLRKVPKGGYVYFQVPTKQIKPGLKRELTYSLYDGGKKPIFCKASWHLTRHWAKQLPGSAQEILPWLPRRRENIRLKSFPSG